MLVWTYDSFTRRDDQPINCCICKGGIGVVAYKVFKSFGRSEQVAFCKSCIDGLRNAGGFDV